MSTRTLIEINHDKLHLIEDDPQGFVEALMLALKSTRHELNHRLLFEYQVPVKHQRHHSDDCPTGVDS